MQFIGPPFTFGLNTVADNTTIAGPLAVTSVQDTVFWMGKNEFYMYTGQVQRMPCSVRDHVFSDLNWDQGRKIVSGLIYLPSPEENDKHLGINFYDYKEKNFQNAHYESEEEQDIFYKNAKLVCKPEFNNRFYFFFRNARSWHDVDVVESLSSEYVRVSINYNILINQSVFGTLRNVFSNK
jgi:hypothetical protein